MCECFLANSLLMSRLRNQSLVFILTTSFFFYLKICLNLILVNYFNKDTFISCSLKLIQNKFTLLIRAARYSLKYISMFTCKKKKKRIEIRSVICRH